MLLYTAALVAVWAIIVGNVVGQLESVCPPVSLSCTWNCTMRDNPLINCEKALGQQENASETHCVGYLTEKNGQFALLVKELKLNDGDSCTFSEYAMLTYYHDNLLLLPASLNAFEGLKRLVLRVRFGFESIKSGVFSAKLASLQNLQLDSPGVSEIEPGAFKELRDLTRLFISNLKVARLTETILQGLSQLRVLELPDNALMTLDAASFSASPRLEYIDLRTRAALSTTVAPDTFCGLTVLHQLQYRGSIGLNCSNFLSPRVRLMISEESDTRNVNCVRSPSNATACNVTEDNTSTHWSDKLDLSTHSTMAGKEATTELISTTESSVTDVALTTVLQTIEYTTRMRTTVAATSSINALTTTPSKILKTSMKSTTESDTTALVEKSTPFSLKPTESTPNTPNRKVSTLLKPTVTTAETSTSAEVTAPMSSSSTASVVRSSTTTHKQPTVTQASVTTNDSASATTPGAANTGAATAGAATIPVVAATAVLILLFVTIVLIIIIVVRRRRGLSMRSPSLLPITVDAVELDDSL